MDNTTVDHYLPTRMSLDSQSELAHKRCLVVVELDPWNHIVSDGFHQIFTIGGCHTTINSIHSPPTPLYPNELLIH